MSIVQIWSRHNIEELGISFFALSAFGVVRRDLFRIRSKAIAVFILRLGEIYNFPIVIICWRNLKELRSREWYGSYTGLDCADHDQRVEEDCKTRKTEFNHHIFVQKLKMTRGSFDLYRKKIIKILVKGKSHFCIDQYFAKRKELHYLNLGGGGALNMKTTIDCTRSLHNLYSRLRFWVSH